MAKMNPFRPNQPVHGAMFVGRERELDRLNDALVQTSYGNPSHFLLTGERGIGKTSLLKYLQYIATGETEISDGGSARFITVFLNLDSKTTQNGLIRNIDSEIRRATRDDEQFREVV